MRTVIEHELWLEVDDPINFATDIAGHARMLLEERFVGTCFKGHYITKILDVITAEYVELQTVGNKGSLSTYMIAEAWHITEGSILPNVEITHVKDAIKGICRTDFGASVYVAITRNDLAISEGMYIPCVVIQSRLGAGRSIINAIARPLTRAPLSQKLARRETDDAEFERRLAAAAAYYNGETEKLSTLTKSLSKRYEYFYKLFAPATESPPVRDKLTDAAWLIENCDGRSVGNSGDGIVVSDPLDGATEESLIIICENMLVRAADFIHAMRIMAQQFETEESFNKNKAIWKYLSA